MKRAAQGLMVLLMTILALPEFSVTAESPLTCGRLGAAPVLTYVPAEDSAQAMAQFTDDMVDYLNATGSAESLEAAIDAAYAGDEPFLTGVVLEMDLTGDGDSDVLVNTQMAQAGRWYD